MAGQHHQCCGHELGQTPGDGEGLGGLVCCSPWACKQSDMAGQLNTTTSLHLMLETTLRRVVTVSLTLYLMRLRHREVDSFPGVLNLGVPSLEPKLLTTVPWPGHLWSGHSYLSSWFSHECSF